MRIISKYKDFYDYKYAKYGIDDSVTYVRMPELCNEVNINSKKIFGISSVVDKIESSLNIKNVWNAYNYYSRLPNMYARKKMNIFSNSLLQFQVVIGIYPHLYFCPIITESYARYSWEMKYYLPTFDEMTCQEKFNDAIMSNYPGYYERSILCSEKYFAKRQKSSFEGKDISMWRAENEEVFDYIGAPVFMLVKNDYYWHIAGKELIDADVIKDYANGKFVIVKNLCIEKLKINPLKRHRNFIDNHIDIYNNIENFVISSKIEPMSEPSNDIKILAAGFDKKTSFRKM